MLKNIEVTQDLLDYIYRTQKGKLPNIRFLVSKNTINEMVIDHSTFKNLEILESNSGFKGGSLVSVIDKTSTSSGGRLLKKYLSAPLYNVEKIIPTKDNDIYEIAHREGTYVHKMRLGLSEIVKL